MLARRKIAVVGGDKRSKYLAQMLNDDKNDVCVYGYDTVEDMYGIKYAAGIWQAVEESDYIVCPVPFAENKGGDKKQKISEDKHQNINENKHQKINENANKDISIFAPLYSGTIPLYELIECINACSGKDKIIFGGAINDDALNMLNEKKCRAIDLLKREDLSVLNAVPSAEGAIQTAMEKMSITIHGCKALIIGYGRIGKILAKLLIGMGADVSVTARKNSDIAWIKVMG